MESVTSIANFMVGQVETPPEIKGLLLRSDENGVFSIGIPVNSKEVVIVAYSTIDDIFDKMMFWADKIEQVKNNYNAKAE